MSPPFWTYLACWLAATVTAAAMLAWRPGDFQLLSIEYRHLLGVRWKLVTFAVGLVGFVALAPLSGVPTWDPVNATFMSILAYATAPWSLATLYRWSRDNASARHAYVAAILWLFSASWAYDGYLLLRNGHYPATWLANLVASSSLYAGAGLMWNLDHDARGVHLAFTREDWPSVRTEKFRPFAPWLLPFAAVGAIVLIAYVQS